jgi:hypothetical protein
MLLYMVEGWKAAGMSVAVNSGWTGCDVAMDYAVGVVVKHRYYIIYLCEGKVSQCKSEIIRSNRECGGVVVSSRSRDGVQLGAYQSFGKV